MAKFNLTVIVQKDEDGVFLASCPTLQGCYADGETLEEALEMIEPVIKMHIDDRQRTENRFPMNYIQRD